MLVIAVDSWIEEKQGSCTNCGKPAVIGLLALTESNITSGVDPVCICEDCMAGFGFNYTLDQISDLFKRFVV